MPIRRAFRRLADPEGRMAISIGRYRRIGVVPVTFARIQCLVGGGPRVKCIIRFPWSRALRQIAEHERRMATSIGQYRPLGVVPVGGVSARAYAKAKYH